MKLFYLKEAVRTEETGDQYPQIIKMSKKQDYYDDNGVYVLSRISLPDTNPDLKHLVLDKKAKITDVLSAAMLRLNGFLITDRVKNILTKYRLPEHRFYYAEVTDMKKNKYPYYWLQMKVDYADLKYVDIAKSEFVVKNDSIIIDPKEKTTRIEVESLQDFNAKKENLSDKKIRLSRVVLNKDFADTPLDIFTIPYFSNGWIISEKLKDELIKTKITGVTISVAENIV
jgi:hypothetical protein